MARQDHGASDADEGPAAAGAPFERPDTGATVDDPATLVRVAGWLAATPRVAVLTGAGISTESGIPDFRGPQGLWTKDPAAEKLATLQHWLSDRDVRVRGWRQRMETAMWSREPNAGHRALVDLERAGHLDVLVTQNVDGLHHAAGSDPARIVEIHGTVREFACLSCGDRGPIETVMARVEAGDDDPPCLVCGGILKSATISFGQELVPHDLGRAERAAATCDVLLCAGTSLTVMPIAAMADVTLRAGARLVICNAEPTPYDRHAAAGLRGRLGTVLPAIAELVARAG
jgi:NAD-dependent deacetylase